MLETAEGVPIGIGLCGGFNVVRKVYKKVNPCQSLDFIHALC